jgi:hypothetical protein
MQALESLVRVSPDDRPLQDIVESIARATDRPARALHLQALLQLPRLADPLAFVPVGVAERLLHELTEELPSQAEWFLPDSEASPRLLRFHSVDTGTAYNVMARFHYLRSPRTDGRAYGLSTSAGRLAALCVSSPLDVPVLSALLASAGRSSERARVVSRVFVFEGAPANSISYMLSKIAREERGMGVTDLVTYVNPNMGFIGSSYMASGWQKLGTEPGTRYRFVDGRYTTDRQLAARFDVHNDEDYQRILGGRFAVSIMPLAPLFVFHRTIGERVHPHVVSCPTPKAKVA